MASLNNNFIPLNVFSRYCVPRRFDKPSPAWLLYAARDGQLSSVLVAAQPQGQNENWRQRRQSGQLSVHEPQSDGTLLKFPQVSMLKTTLCSSIWEVPSILSIKSFLVFFFLLFDFWFFFLRLRSVSLRPFLSLADMWLWSIFVSLNIFPSRWKFEFLQGASGRVSLEFGVGADDLIVKFIL